MTSTWISLKREPKLSRLHLFLRYKEIPLRMNPAIPLIKILNLQFPFPTTIKIQVKNRISLFIKNIAVTGFRKLLTFQFHFKLAICCKFQNGYWYFDKFVFPVRRFL